MVVEKILVDGLAASKALIDAVPERDIRFAELPAKIDLYAAEERGEVDQADVEVLDKTPDFADLSHRLPQALGCGLTALPHAGEGVAIQVYTAQHHDTLRRGTKFRIGILVLSFR